MKIPFQNLQLQHKMHQKLGHQQTTNLLEFQLGLLVQDKIHMIHNHTPRRNITFNFPSNSDDEIQDETQNITSLRNTSVNVSSPTRTISNTTQNITRSIYDHPSLPSIFKYPNKTIRSDTFINTSASIPKYLKPFDSIDHSYTPEEYLQQVVAR